MRWFRWKARREPLAPATVTVELVNARTGAVMGAYEAPLDRMPDDMTGRVVRWFCEPWTILSAEPSASSAFRQTRFIRATVHKEGCSNESIPMLLRASSCSPYFWPETIERDVQTRDELAVDYALWREVELVARAYDSEVQRDLAEINDIWAYAHVSGGFVGFHQREAVPEPLAAAKMPVTALDRLPRAKTYTALAMGAPEIDGSVPGLVPDGFAFDTTGGLTCCGRAFEGILTEFCIEEVGTRPVPAEDIAALASLLAEYDLYLVDWTRGELADADGLATYFTRFHTSDAP